MLNRLQAVFASFEAHGCEYVVIGGIAAVLHGVPRATFDLDILIAASPENSRRVLDALRDAGMGTAAMVTPEELLGHEITVFQDRVRLDVQTSTPGLAFLAAWEHKVRMEYQGQVFYVVSREDLIASKRASGRAIDLEDVKALEDTNKG
ncbi:MAG: DUF6036 family nucleotidyltransferase [Acidobacteriota bacterium]